MSRSLLHLFKLSLLYSLILLIKLFLSQTVILLNFQFQLCKLVMQRRQKLNGLCCGRRMFEETFGFICFFNGIFKLLSHVQSSLLSILSPNIFPVSFDKFWFSFCKVLLQLSSSFSLLLFLLFLNLLSKVFIYFRPNLLQRVEVLPKMFFQ